MNYTPAGMLSIYRAVLSVDKKQKLAMDLNRFSVNFICMFTQIMWYLMGLTHLFQIRSYVTTCGARIELMR
jgi:hypothetical protein